MMRRLRSIQPLMRANQIAIVEACTIGIVSALAAMCLKHAVWWLEAQRLELAGTFSPWIVVPLGIVGGLMSGLLVERFAPEAAGSGIPQVKAALGHVPIALDLRVAAVKWVSTAIALGSGLALGRQGPTVQIGAALAAQLSHWRHVSPLHHRQLIAAGAAAGLAASFNAPLAGVLFAIEELLQDVSDLTLGTAIIAAVVGGAISRAWGGRGTIPDLSQLSIQFSLAEIPLLIGLGICAGILGALCNRSLLASLQLYERHLRDRSLALKVGIAGGITGAIGIFVPYGLAGGQNLQDFLIVGDLNWQTAGGILVSQLVLCLVAFGSGAPGGLFAPSLILGAALGTEVATIVQASDRLGLDLVLSSPTVYALTGMSAVFSAITHRPLFAIAIVWEMTTQFDLLLPLTIGAVSAYIVAERLFPGSLYDRLLKRKGIDLSLPDLAGRTWSSLTAADVMQRRFATLDRAMPIAAAIDAFANSTQRGLPIVDDGRLVGILTQSDLANCRSQWDRNTQVGAVMTQRVITLQPQDPLSAILYLLDRHQIRQLPVLEGQKLVGIVARADIIRAEAELLNPISSPFKTRPQPSYCVYQTRSAATGKGRLLVPLSNPQTADLLLRLAGEIARKFNYELECLHAIVIPTASNPATTSVDIDRGRELCDRANSLGRVLGISVHTQIRVTHNLAATILETISDRHIDILCMGWQGKSSHPGRMFGNTLDMAIAQAPCHTLLVKFSKQLQADWPATASPEQRALEAMMRLAALDRWLLPIAGGSNAEYGLELLSALTSLSRQPEIHLCQVFPTIGDASDLTDLQTAAALLRDRLEFVPTIAPLAGDNVATAAIDYGSAIGCNAMILGASCESLLHQTVRGSIPDAIARQSDCTTIVVRKAGR